MPKLVVVLGGRLAKFSLYKVAHEGVERAAMWQLLCWQGAVVREVMTRARLGYPQERLESFGSSIAAPRNQIAAEE